MSEEQKSLTFEESTFIDEENSSNTDDSMSSDGLEIDISESPRCKKEINIEDKQVLENIEEEIERQYDEKAAKSNLTAVNVKNILKHVITNEHVWAMVRNTTEENVQDEEAAVYEPKLTRAKAKELLKSHPTIPWVSPVPKSEVHLLINEELPEDSDDDEYVPQEEESEDEKDSCAESQPRTPATPATPTHDNSTQTIWTEDGMFKVPPTPKNQDVENIALRTRSKLSLSDTPLEIIEEALIPPDITTDMYDLECDDEDWKDFLKKFTRPLDEGVTGTQEDDDEADPEYNVLSDEEIDKLDKEELRQDKGVKVTKKELNTLVAELFEFSEMFSSTRENPPENKQPQQIPAENFPQPPENFQELPPENFPQTTENFTQPQNINNSQPPESSQIIKQVNVVPMKSDLMSTTQLMLFEQQMRQHVQMLTQNYILSYKHVYFGELAQKFKNMILSLHDLSKYKHKSAFRAHNLSLCLEFIKDWDKMVATNSKEVLEMLTYVSKVAREFKRSSEKNYEYVATFPDLLMKKVSESPGFMYPSLLPKVPFRYSSKITRKNYYIKPENDLIALGLEQFRNHLKGNLLFRSRNGLLSNQDVSKYICSYMLPNRDPKRLYWYIQRMRYAKEPNPINYYFVNKKAPISIHYVCSLEEFGVLPPCMRPADSLPYLWKKYLHPDPNQKIEQESKPKRISKRATKPPAYKKPAKKAKLKISSADDQPQIANLNTVPILIINNVVHAQSKSETKNNPLPPVLIINNNSTSVPEKCAKENPVQIATSTPLPQQDKDKLPTGNPGKRKRIIIPQVEQIFIKTQDYFISNTNETISQFVNSETIGEPPPVCTAEQIKKISPEILNVQFNSTIFQRVKDLDMLPSMPYLLTPVKEARNLNEPDEGAEEVHEEDPLKIVENDETLKIVNKVEKVEQVEKVENVETVENLENTVDCSKSTEEIVKVSEENESIEESKKDDEDELNALMVASSTMQQKNRRLQPNLTKKAKQMREYNANLAMLCPEDDTITEVKATNFAQAYYDKVQERLESESPVEYQKFMEVLSDHDDSKSTVSELYDKVSSILSPGHPDLCEEFLTFLTPEQAQQIGKLVPHFMLSNMSLFLRKLEMYYNNQPAQLRKIYNSLTELASTSDITMDRVKNTILPLLKGNGHLIDWFLQMFPREPPPESLQTNWEQLEDEDIEDDQKIFETLTLPDVEDPYGGPNCICKCHKIEDEMYKNRTRHCIPCGTKFLQGRVYVQTGKGLRLANVTFNSPNSDHIKRITVKPIVRQKRKSETSPSKIIMSPVKDEEPRHSNESEDDGNTKTKSSLKTSSPSKPRKKPTQKIPKSTKKETKTKSVKTKKTKQTKPQQKKETKVETKTETKEGDKTVESETEEIESMDTCEESSQDTLEESDESVEEIESESEESNSPPDVDIWTRDEDKIILETYQKCQKNENVVKEIQKCLPGRSEPGIKTRIQELLKLVKKMSN